jgi:hypothetical protein
MTSGGPKVFLQRGLLVDELGIALILRKKPTGIYMEL